MIPINICSVKSRCKSVRTDSEQDLRLICYLDKDDKLLSAGIGSRNSETILRKLVGHETSDISSVLKALAFEELVLTEEASEMAFILSDMSTFFKEVDSFSKEQTFFFSPEQNHYSSGYKTNDIYFVLGDKGGNYKTRSDAVIKMYEKGIGSLYNKEDTSPLVWNQNSALNWNINVGSSLISNFNDSGNKKGQKSLTHIPQGVDVIQIQSETNNSTADFIPVIAQVSAPGEESRCELGLMRIDKNSLLKIPNSSNHYLEKSNYSNTGDFIELSSLTERLEHSNYKIINDDAFETAFKTSFDNFKSLTKSLKEVDRSKSSEKTTKDRLLAMNDLLTKLSIISKTREISSKVNERNESITSLKSGDEKVVAQAEYLQKQIHNQVFAKKLDYLLPSDTPKELLKLGQDVVAKSRQEVVNNTKECGVSELTR